jgi:two-component system phosphate regulon sensor histidine kinase PhoR
VLFDSQVLRDSLRYLENHHGRPEILRSRTDFTGIDRRHSSSTGHDYIYAARRLAGHTLGALDSGYVRGALSIEETDSLDADVRMVIWGVGFISLIALALVSHQVARRITGPILDIARTARAIKDGDLSQRITVRSHDEIGMLATSINEMAATLSADIAQLRKLELVRTQFLGNVSHELRTPIFSLQGFLETLLDGALDDPAVNREFLEKAHKHAMRLNALLSDLIEIARIESGEMKMSFRYFPIADLVRDAIDEMRPAAERKRIDLRLESSGPEGLKAYGDRDRLKQVLINLIDNAIKYTETGGTVRCAAAEEGGKCWVSVSDTGVGIAAEHLPRIFERFYRVDRDRSRQVGGTGLGLAIVKHIVEAHGGSIAVTSTPGTGSTFTVWLRK